jgi:hypothetical protein
MTVKIAWRIQDRSMKIASWRSPDLATLAVECCFSSQGDLISE